MFYKKNYPALFLDNIVKTQEQYKNTVQHYTKLSFYQTTLPT